MEAPFVKFHYKDVRDLQPKVCVERGANHLNTTRSLA